MSFLEGELKDEIAELSRSIENMKKNLERYTAEEKTLRSLRAKIAEIKLQFLDSDQKTCKCFAKAHTNCFVSNLVNVDLVLKPIFKLVFIFYN